jgi:hypothetical protein
MNTDFSYIKTLQDTISETKIRELAHGVMLANKSAPSFVESQLSAIRQKLIESKTNSFQNTIDSARQLARMAKHAALISKAERV